MFLRPDRWFRKEGVFVALEFGLIALLGITLAHWTWVALTPRTIASSEKWTGSTTSGASVVSTVIKRNLFGTARGDGLAEIPNTPRSTSLRLVGVLARDSTRGGRAILALESGKMKEVGVGSQISQGIVLKEVHSDHVIVSHNGVLGRLPLDRRTALGK